MNVGSTFFPTWLVLLVIAALVIYFLGLWSKIWAWAKVKYTESTGKEASGKIIDALDAFVIGAESFKVQKALRIAQIEFEEREDTQGVESIDALLAKVAVWRDKKE